MLVVSETEESMRRGSESEEEDGTTGSSMVSSMAKKIAAVEKLLGGYQFRDPSLLVEALTHPSHASLGPTYQRLEFIGDAALALAISNYLFLTNRHVGPGRLSSFRAANISTEKLARIAVRHNLYPLLLRDAPSLDLMVTHFAVAVEAEQPDHCNDHADLNNDVSPPYPAVYGGTTLRAPKVLADVVESIIGAVYVDCEFNLERMWVAVRGMLEPIITEENHHDQPVSMLYEICQKSGRVVELKNWVKGTKNIMNVFVDGQLLGIGCSEQKNIAKLNAARDALPKLWAEMELDSPMLDATVAANTSTHAYTTATLTSSTTTTTTTTTSEGKKNLNELCSKNRWLKPTYRVETEEGPAHEKRFKCSVQVTTSWDVFVTYGDFKSKVKDAENSAAYKMLIKLRLVFEKTGLPF